MFKLCVLIVMVALGPLFDKPGTKPGYRPIAVDEPGNNHGSREAKVDTAGDIIAAIRSVETSDAADPPNGDGGKALGPLQIHEAFWVDSGISGSWQNCHDFEYSKRVVVAYWQRYEPAAYSNDDNRTLALCFHYGPHWRSRNDPDGYWTKVKAKL
jgi:hypothetical protein